MNNPDWRVVMTNYVCARVVSVPYKMTDFKFIAWEVSRKNNFRLWCRFKNSLTSYALYSKQQKYCMTSQQFICTYVPINFGDLISYEIINNAWNYAADKISFILTNSAISNYLNYFLFCCVYCCCCYYFVYYQIHTLVLNFFSRFFFFFCLINLRLK